MRPTFGDEEKINLPTSLTLVDGEKLEGALLLSRAQHLFEALNKPDPFIEFQTRDGRLLVIAKSAIRSATQLEGRKSPPSSELLRRPVHYDPYKLLGIARDAPPSAIRPAYVEKAKVYHPDQFAAHPLPPEVVTYLEAMFVQIQRAYDDLSGQAQKGAA